MAQGPGLALCERFFEAEGLPALRAGLGDRAGRLAAGLVGDGSECFGFDDDISRDHDWGPGFCVWMTEADFAAFGGRVQAIVDSLPQTFEGYGPRAVSDWGEGRIGVFSIGGFFARFLGMDRLPETNDEWLMIPENALAAATNGRVFFDPVGEFSRWRAHLSGFYPEDVRKKKIASRAMTAGQSGQYNFPRCVARAEFFCARYAEVKFASDAMSMAHLLVRRYAPFYKWLHKSTARLPDPGPEVARLVDALGEETDRAAKADLIEQTSECLIAEAARQDLTDSPSDFLVDHGPVIAATITDPDLASRNVWVG